MPLDRAKLTAFVATVDLARARAFYVGRLGLRMIASEPHALVLDAAGTMLRVSLALDHAPAQFTVLGWDVPDLGRAIEELRSVGVRFERFDFLEQDERAVWRSPDGTLVAWLRDPDGNLLSLTQFPSS